jgi:hypothetical protein
MRHVVEALKGVSPDASHWYAWRRTLKSQRLLHLCDRMRAALKRYGPRERYPAAAKYQAIAHILRAFKVEEGQEDTVAARVRRRLDRLDRSQHSPPQD